MMIDNIFRGTGKQSVIEITSQSLASCRSEIRYLRKYFGNVMIDEFYRSGGNWTFVLIKNW